MSQDLWGEEEEFQDKPDEIEIDSNGVQKQAPPAQLPRPSRPPQLPVQKEPEPELEEVLEELEEDFSEVLNDANLRIEQGRLYQMIMNHNLFQDMDADPRAIANVEREIKKFARESMEVMLGMRQTTPAHAEIVSSPFNELEVDILKKLASKATNGATESPSANAVAERLKEPAKRTTISPIGTQKKAAPKVQQPVKKPLQTKAATPLKRTKLDLDIEQIALEEGVPRELLEENIGLLGAKVDNMSAEEILEHNKIVSQRRRLAKSSEALPMPSFEQQQAMAVAHANKISAMPGVDQILEKVKRMPPTKT